MVTIRLDPCADCGNPFEEKELDDEGFCDECAEEIRQERKAERQLRSDYYASVL